ncbi:MAG: deoxyguanosinetriphosphate triphosphohydrolase [Proteobacteria bacterium]|nr:deoxyguanosinetriphosphate triphosphohydrolase [Pseudomonadota bacterium]
MNFSLAPYASDAAKSRGRAHPEPESRHRTPFQRDRDRIIHSTAFRRLKHKTQVFVAPEGDHYRTRLTHSLEVAQIARALGRTLRLDEDLCEALALAHDFGHPPFGHAGEEALDEAMGGFGRFDHNGQTLRVLTMLERRYPDFDGLNLCWETLEGIAKHNGPVESPSPTLRAIDRMFPLELATFPGPEAQVAAIADDIAYNNHDLDDGLRAGAFKVDDLREVPHVAAVFARVRAQYPDIAETRLVHEMVRRLIGDMEDVLAETARRLARSAPVSVADVRNLPEAMVAFSPAMSEKERTLKDFLFRHMYRHEAVVAQTGRARVVVKQLFEMFIENPQELPPEWRRAASAPNSPETARIVADYIAGMTDQYALREHRQLIEKNS